jgi:3-hydroxyacyl-[acyl-carrier-protein] dehydratase
MSAVATAAARSFVVGPDHPALTGHFPGRPVVPGVLLLDAVLAAAGCGGAGARLLRVRFTAPVLPGDAVEVEIGPATRLAAGPSRLAFTCRRGGAAVLSGEIECGTQPP